MQSLISVVSVDDSMFRTSEIAPSTGATSLSSMYFSILNEFLLSYSCSNPSYDIFTDGLIGSNGGSSCDGGC